jgi:photosystem II stability/assembly factor-like uncharacterized protein
VLYRSRDGGSSWEKVFSSREGERQDELWAESINAVESISFSPATNSKWFIVDWWRVWKTSDAGVTWTPSRQGLQNFVVNDIKIDPVDPAKIYMAVADNGLVVSNDLGVSWQRKMSGIVDGHAQEVEFSSQNPNKLYLIMNPWQREGNKIYVYKSMNGGSTWNDVSFYPRQALDRKDKSYVSGGTTNIEIDPFSDEIIYVATDGYGIYRSSDGGMSWSPIHYGLKNPFVKGPGALLAVPYQGRTLLYLSTMGGGIYRSDDRGDTWKLLTGKYNFAFGMSVAKDNPLRIAVALPQKKLIISENGGESWKEITLPGEISQDVATYAVAFSPFDSQTIIAGTLAFDFKKADGLFISSDGGASFKRVPFPVNFPFVNVNVLHIPLSNPSNLLEFYVGFNGIGIYRVKMDPNGL